MYISQVCLFSERRFVQSYTYCAGIILLKIPVLIVYKKVMKQKPCQRSLFFWNSLTIVCRIISDYTVLLLKKFPEVIVQQKTELSDFLSVTRNITGRERFFSQLVCAL